MAIAIESASSDIASDTSDTLLEPSVPSGLQVGDRLYAFAGVITRTIATPSGWTLEDSYVDGSITLYVFSKTADETDVSAGTFTFVANGGFNSGAIVVVRLSGASSDAVVAEFATGPNLQTQTAPTVITPAANCLVFWGVYRNSNLSGVTSSKGAELADNFNIALYADTVALAGSVAGATLTTGAFSPKQMVSFAVTPSAGGGGSIIPLVMQHRRMMGVS